MRVDIWPVMVEDWQFECCGRPFAVGDEVAWRLMLWEPDDARVPDELLVRLDAQAEPFTHPEADEGTIVLRAGLLTASWWPAQPAHGRVSLRGLLVEDHHGFAPLDLPATAGTVRRIQVVMQGYEEVGDRTWRQVANRVSLSDVPATPARLSRDSQWSGSIRWSVRGMLVGLAVPPSG